MTNNRFLEEAKGDADMARQLRKAFYKKVYPNNPHLNCSHENTTTDRAACRRRAKREAKDNAAKG